jgi:gliding motility-associated-like protein
MPGANSAGFAAVVPGTYRVEFITDKGCRRLAEDVITLGLIRKPIPEIGYDLYCKGLPINFKGQGKVDSSGMLTWAWDLGDGSVPRTGRNITQTYGRAGAYMVKLTVTPTLCSGLAAMVSRSIAIDSMPGPMKYDIVNAVVGVPTNLEARGIGESWRWDPAIQLTGTATRNPVFKGDRSQQYLITIRKSSGCETVDTLLVRVVKESGIYVPAGFSPDNDGINDRLFPHIVGIREMKSFRVFNRWGGLVYDNRLASATTGWDGTFRGRPQPLETYTWLAEGYDHDGKLIRKTGNVVLIR